MEKYVKKVMGFLILCAFFVSVSPQPVIAETSEETYLTYTNQEMVEEFEAMKIEYTIRLSIENDETQISQLNMIISQIQYYIDYYSGTVKKRNTLCEPYQATAAAISIWFKSKGYTLANEMLLFYFANKSANTYYSIKGTNLSKITGSSWFSTINNKWPVGGSSSFPNGDLFYAIHAFSYNATSTYGQVELRDVYDFQYNNSAYNSITQNAVNAMVHAETFKCACRFNVSATLKTK